MDNTKLTGVWGEDMAADYLKRKRYKIIERNYRVRSGEIDIIAQNGEYIVFVEVKTRKNSAFASAMEYVTQAKQRKLISAALSWLSENSTDMQPRFDVIEVYSESAKGGKPRINHIEDAFGA